MSHLFSLPEPSGVLELLCSKRRAVMEISVVFRIFSLARCPAVVSAGSRGCQVLHGVHGSAMLKSLRRAGRPRHSCKPGGSCRGMDPIQEHHTSFKDLWSPNKPEGVVQLLLPGRAGVIRCRDVLVSLFAVEMCCFPFSSSLAQPAQRGLPREGVAEVTLMGLPRFRAKHQLLGCFQSWKTCGFRTLEVT